MKTTIFSQISIDGKLTLGAGNSSKDLFKLFSNEDLEFIHKFRGKVDGIMVGRKTIITDNPFLTNRYEENRNPVRIIPTSTMDIPPDSNVLVDKGRTIVATTEKGFDKEKADLITGMGKQYIVCGKEKLDFKELFRCLEEQHNIKSVMVEGGGQLNWSIVANDLADEIILMQLPIIIGGTSNITLVDGIGYRDMSSTKKYRIIDIQPRENYTLLRFARNAYTMHDRPVA
ncbi:MAG: dihydrofolate reductase family protein [Clostridia bacterium]|nr:dihydrofolate reductase family protein [Clostridia bacterium]